MLYPDSRITTFVLFFLVRIPAWFFLGGWFLYQLIEANFGMFGATAHGGGIGFFAHVSGFVFGVIVAMVLALRGELHPKVALPSCARPTEWQDRDGMAGTAANRAGNAQVSAAALGATQ